MLQNATLANISFSDTQIKLKRGTAAEWAAANPVLAAGEPAFETDTGILRVGDGTTVYTSLPSCNGATVDALLVKLTALNAKLFATSTGVGVGTETPAATALFEILSTTQGFLPPRMTTTQRNAITSPAAGLMIYNTTTLSLEMYDGTSWDTYLANIVDGGTP